MSDLLLYAAEAEECRRSLKAFTQYAWDILEPGTKLRWAWFHDAICEHLQACYEGQIHRLVISIAPGHTKSTIVSQIFPMWVWTRNPAFRWLCASTSLDLAIRDNRNSRYLAESDWYRARYGREFHVNDTMFDMSQDQSAKSYYENDHKGYRMAVSVTSRGIGKRADGQIIDDPHDPMEGDVRRQEVIEWFKQTWISRLNDQENGLSILVGQRIHAQDLSGYALDLGGSEHLNLPEEFELARKSFTKIGWSDPRTEEGELLWPDKFPVHVLTTLKSGLGPYGYAAQYSQQPVPSGGYVFKQENERLFTVDHEAGLYLLETPHGIKSAKIRDCWTCTTSDVAIKKHEQADFTVFATWAITPEKDVLLLDVRREHWTFPEQKEQARKTFYAWNDDTYACLYFEDVGYQSSIGQDLIEEGIPCKPFSPKGQDKLLRATGASIWQGAGKVYFKKHAHWLEGWRKEIYLFPKDAHDDRVDCLSMICMIVRPHAPQAYNLNEVTPEEKHQQEEDAKKPVNPFEWVEAHGGWN